MSGSAPSITADWLAKLVSARGRIDDVSVQRIGDGVGLVSIVSRVTVRRADARLPDGRTLPASIIVKTPNADPAVRAMTAELRLHRREAIFYRDFATRLGNWIPECYGMEMEADGTASIALQDVPGAATDLRTPCTVEQAEVVLRCIAEAHARWWGRAHELPDVPGVESAEKQVLQPRLTQLMPVFDQRWGDRVTDRERTIAHALAPALPTVLTAVWRFAPPTLIHFDLRLGNLLWGGPADAYVIDWQTLSTGPAAFDVAYFLASSIDARELEQHEDRLLRTYHQQLCAAGVTDYPLESLREHVHVALLPALAVALVVGCSMLGIVTGPGIEGIERWVERALAAAARLAPAPETVR